MSLRTRLTQRAKQADFRRIATMKIGYRLGSGIADSLVAAPLLIVY